MAATSESSGEVLRSERIAGGILPKTLNTFDMVAIFIAIVLYISNSPGIAAAGPVSYIYLVAGFVTFLIPCAIVTGQLGRMFPNEGSIYVWTTKAFGPFMGFFAGFCAWWPGVFVIIVNGSLTASFISRLGAFFGVSLLDKPWQVGIVIIAVTAFSFWLSVIKFRAAQNLVNIIFVTYSTAIVLIGLAGALWFFTGHPSTTNLAFNGGGWGINGVNFPIFGFVILALLGVEVPLNMGVEVTSERAVTRYLIWGPIVVMVAYLITTFGVMVAVPTANQTNITSLVDAVVAGFGPAGMVFGIIVNLCMLGFTIFGCVVYNYSFGRLLFVSGLDRSLPAVMSKVNKHRVPWVAVLVQSIIIAVLGIAIYMILPYILPGFNTPEKQANLSNVMYYILLGALTVIWCLSMVFQFIDVIVIRFKYAQAFVSMRLAPDWAFYLCSAIGLIASGIGIYATVSAPWVPTLIDTAPWQIWIASLITVSLVAAAVIYIIGLRRIKHDVSDEQAIADAIGKSMPDVDVTPAISAGADD